MQNLNTHHFLNCIQTLEATLQRLHAVSPDSIEYDIFRNAALKSFELTLETAGKLLRKALKSYAENPRAVDELTYKDIFRHAIRHGLVTSDQASRWFQYRDDRNSTAHDYGKEFANATLKLLPSFLSDARALEKALTARLGSGDA